MKNITRVAVLFLHKHALAFRLMCFQSFRSPVTISGYAPITSRALWALCGAFMMLPGFIKEAIGGILCDKLCGENEEFRLVFLNLALSAVSLVISSTAIPDTFSGNSLLNL